MIAVKRQVINQHSFFQVILIDIHEEVGRTVTMVFLAAILRDKNSLIIAVAPPVICDFDIRSIVTRLNLLTVVVDNRKQRIVGHLFLANLTLARLLQIFRDVQCGGHLEVIVNFCALASVYIVSESFEVQD